MGGPRDPSGLATVAASGPRPAVPRAAPDAQGSLFGAAVPDPDGVGELAPPPAGPRPPGRPAGSRNRSTEEWARYLLTRYRSPLVGLAELAQANPHALAEELTVAGEGGRVTPLDALRVIVGAAQALAPYLHQRQPVALDMGGGGLMQVFIGDLGAAQGAEARILPAEETVVDQDVSGSPDAGSESAGRNA